RERRVVRARKFWIGFLAPVAAAALVVGFFHIRYQSLSASTTNLEILGQSRLIPGSDAAMRIRLTDARSHGALSGVPVDVVLKDAQRQQEVKLASFITDSQGN